MISTSLIQKLAVLSDPHRLSSHKPTVKTILQPGFPADMFQLRFGKRIEVLGTGYDVPDAVHEKAKGVKFMFTSNADGGFSPSNAVHLGNNRFIGASHSITHDPAKTQVHLGDLDIEDKNLYAHPGSILANAPQWDLALFERRPKGPLKEPTPEISLAKNPAEEGESVYIVGSHEDIGGPHVLPAECWSGSYKKQNADPKEIGADAGIFMLHTPVVENKSFYPPSISGSAVLNGKGELVGILPEAEVDEQNDSNGFFYAVDVETIRHFLNTASPALKER